MENELSAVVLNFFMLFLNWARCSRCSSSSGRNIKTPLYPRYLAQPSIEWMHIGVELHAALPDLIHCWNISSASEDSCF